MTRQSEDVMQIIRDREQFDVCVVGSGAGGGMAARVLTEAGARVLMLECGVDWDPVKDSKMFAWSYESPRRGASTTDRPLGEFLAANGGWTIEGEPYTVRAGSTFDWFRCRMVGGRTNHWGRISLRFGPDDFQRKSLDSLGDDWPITYDDVKPYYDKIDRLIGIFGSNEGFRNEPDGIFQPPPAPRCYELLIKQAAGRLNVPCVPSRMSILTQQLGDRPACHYCGECARGCALHSNFSSPSVLLPPAMKTGRLILRTNAMAREVTVDASGRATGVTYVDTRTGRENHVNARIVVLAASACESARILLNSKSTRFPQGLANSSGVVGKYLTDSTGVSVSGFIPKLMDWTPHNEDGIQGGHLYVPWWLDNKKLDFPRVYHIELGGGRRMPSAGFGGNIQRFNGMDGGREIGGYGASLKQDYRRFYGATINLAGRGEMIPNADSFCEIDPNTVDKFGIPVLRFSFKWTDHEIKQAKHMQETFRGIITEMGGTAMSAMPAPTSQMGLATPGRIIHEIGTIRMGKDPKSSAVNGFGQAHDVPNLFVADGGPFVSQPDKNPTWTILALSMRASEYIADERRKGNL
jgi:choline dehydrogenase-like flavoprotein